ncbi:ABC transporter ATP-binding protein [Falsiroseomonas sp. HW251]|uniref:ABC transporter ATP-binding protein n=1 Tax=Falsiroseomonas sp. HW251 TaxID=3390998 RepID=UPI003D315396
MLEIRDLHLAMRSFEGEAHVLNGISLSVARGEVWGLVGETGCGKSLTGLSVSRLVAQPPGRYLRGQVIFDGQDVLSMPGAALRALRGRRIGMIFQDPTTNLNPAFRVASQMIDVALHAGAPNRRAARDGAIRMLDRVGIVDAAKRVDDYPHQFSGGMRQRVLIAMALLGRPDLLVADEPTTALDVSVQAQILRLLHDLVQQDGLGVLLITHNLGVVAQICSHVAVMYAGNVVETGPVRAIFRTPCHPYTRALLEALPGAGAARGALRSLAGQVPNLFTPPPGCRFAPRCPRATPECEAGTPPLAELAPAHRVACLHPHA